MTNKFNLDKEKYFKIIKEKGISQAITTLHKDMWELELECFEGTSSYDPSVFKSIEKFRNFSIELWHLKQKKGLKV